MQSFLDNIPFQPGVVISIISICLSILVFIFSYRETQRARKNSNSWETFKHYTDPDMERARQAARRVLNDANWKAVHTYDQYRLYFRLGEDPEGPDKGAIAVLRKTEQDLHNLMNYFNELGMLLDNGLLDRDFTLQLVGEGMADRWDVLGRIPPLFAKFSTSGHAPYPGMYLLYDAYLRWEKRRYPRISKKAEDVRKRYQAKSGT